MSTVARILPRARDANRATILVAEDEVLVRSVLAEHLRDSGFEVLEASNAAEAMDVLESGEPVDLVFSDIAMPGIMNGVMLARWIREHRPDVCVMLASGSVQSAQALAGERLFLKPYELGKVEADIRDALHWR